MNKINVEFFVIFAIFALIFFPGCSRKTPSSKELIIFHAGSLSVPFKKIAAEFKKEHPEVRILTEAAGSRTCARKISELKRKCDIMASADYTVINQLLIPEYADWNIRFASNEMTIVYSDASKRSKEINSGNWYEILLDKNIKFGRSDPNADPCGYRAVLTVKLAEKFYKKEHLASSFLNKDNRFIRPKETDLLALLETGAIDYIFLYRSVAQQHGLKYIILPDEINLKSAKFAKFYSSASVRISGKKPGKFIIKKGAPMIYGITIPKNTPNRKAAMVFVKFLLSEKGMEIMKKLGQPSVVPSESATFDKIPDTLKKFVRKSIDGK